MIKTFLLITVISLSLGAYDFGAVPQVKVADIPTGKPLMIEFGKTKCVWCEHMAPYFKEIKAEHPKTSIYYVNTDKDVLGAINYNIVELPTAIFWNAQGKEIGRVVGYLKPDEILEALKYYGVLVE